jgi:hypothetical protein
MRDTFYKLLGMVVWNGGKFSLRQRYGSTYAPKPVLAGVAVVLVTGVAVAVAVARRNGSNE